MIKAVFFELDRTLLDRDTSVRLFAQGQYDRLYPYLKQAGKETYVTRFVELDNHGLVRKDRVYKQLVQELRVRRLTWQDFYKDYRANFRYTCRVFQDTDIVLDMLKQAGFLLGIITNGSGHQMTNIRAINIEHYFDVILISEWEGVKKPEPEIFHRALGKLRVSASESVFIGDNPIADIAGAGQVGMKTIWKRDNPEQESVTADAVADAVIDNLSELLTVLQQLNGAKL